MNNTQRRILSDLKDLQSSHEELKNLGIFYHYDEENIHSWKAIIMGTKNTPYEYGFHLFHITIPDVYPMKPPTVKYVTGDGKTRFNPNLYIEGKVCLSLLGTWTGPGWVPVYTLKTVLMTIQAAVLNEDPLMNEPGYEKSSRSDLNIYNDLIEHQNIRIAIISQLTKIPHTFEMFVDVISERFKSYYPELRTKIAFACTTKHNKNLKSPIYGMNITTNYKTILKEIDLLYEKLTSGVIPMDTDFPYNPASAHALSPAPSPDPAPDPSSDLAPFQSVSGGGASQSTTDPIAIAVKKKTKKTPTPQAKNFDENYVMESDNHVVDGVQHKYIVKIKSNGVKYWKHTI